MSSNGQKKSKTPVQAEAASQRGTNILVVLALVFSVSGAVSGFIPALPGVVLGHIALRRSPSSQAPDRKLAVASLIIGYIVIAMGILFLLPTVISSFIGWDWWIQIIGKKDD